MKNKLVLLLVLLIPVAFFILYPKSKQAIHVETVTTQKSYWMVLHRKSERELLYLGVPGDPNNSRLVKTFQVKPGIPGSSPTPLPSLLGKDYWHIIKKEEAFENPETAPYFLTLDIPATEEWPYGPVPYEECSGQCDWTLPGYFGLHGINGLLEKLSKENLGSSGCIRHKDEDITYLYNLLDPEKEKIRYYILDI